MKSKFKVDALLTKVFAITFPYMVLYLLSAWILGDWNILLYSRFPKLIIIAVSLSNVGVVNAGLNKNMKCLFDILIGVGTYAFLCFLACAFDKLTAIIISFGNLEYKRIFQSPKIHADKRYNTI
jgi:hypothetical protein